MGIESSVRTALRIAALLIVAGLARSADGQDSLRIAAIVNDDVISVLDLAVRTSMVILSSRVTDSPEIRSRLAPQVLRGLIDERLKMQEAKRLGIPVSKQEIDREIEQIANQNNMKVPEFEAVLRKSGILISSLAAQFESDIAWRGLLERQLRPSIVIGDDEIDEELAQINANLGKPEYRVAEVFLARDSSSSDEQVRLAAERLAEQIRQGVDFAAVARQFSQSASAAAGGDLGWVRPGELDPALDAVLPTMREGDVAGPIRSAGGYHILQLRRLRQTSAGESSEGKVSLKQFFLPVAANAPEREVQQANKLAQQVAAQAQTCEDLERLTKELSPKTQSDLPGVAISELPRELVPIALNQPIGKASQPVQFETGIGVFMVCSREAADTGVPSRLQIAERLSRERLDLLARGYLRDLRRAAFIDIRV